MDGGIFTCQLLQVATIQGTASQSQGGSHSSLTIVIFNSQFPIPNPNDNATTHSPNNGYDNSPYLERTHVVLHHLDSFMLRVSGSSHRLVVARFPDAG